MLSSIVYQASFVKPWFIFWQDLSQNTHGEMECKQA